ncbi:dockerin type I repeat-containing protein [Acetivibrio thermocellus]|nr:dockerin type I repeat-containing protein [Acetivibrio thermocellus]UWV47070.1 dockerin type I repeat-containing protein [Acetivibrio thermocellus]
MIAVIDTKTVELKEKIDIKIRPFNIFAGKNGYLYVTSREPQKAYFNSYSRSTKEFMDSELVNNECLSEYNPTLDRIYAIPIDIMPIDYKVLNVDNGKFVSSYSSTYYDSYPLAEKFKISPDGKYLFNSSGVVFTCNENVNEDMKFAFTLDKKFTDIAFNMEENRFYTAVGGNQIYVYNYEDFSGIDTLSSTGEILKLFYVDGKLCALSRSANGRPMFEVIQKVKIKYGDVNKDGRINSTDIMYLKGYLLRNSAFNLDEYGLMAADVDGNGSVSSLDLTYLKRYILRRISDFPANKK